MSNARNPRWSGRFPSPIASLQLLGLIFLLQALPLPGDAAIIGTNQPAEPLTIERISQLPQLEQKPWRDYLSRSDQQAKNDRKFFWNEIQQTTNRIITAPPAARGTRGLWLDKETDWYRSADAIRIATIICSFQTPAGGWSKNLDMTLHPRAPGEMFAQGNLNKFSNPEDLDQPHDPNWNYVGTFDNGATIAQLRFLARVVTASGTNDATNYTKAFERGLEYIFAAQFPNGGWPQVWPLQGGYHDAITYNDGAMTAILDLLADITDVQPAFSFVSPAKSRQASAGLQRGQTCVLACQVRVNGQLTVWGQQHDALTLLPTSARNYEMPSLSSGESAGVLKFLMRRSKSDPNLGAAIRAAAEWFKRSAIQNKAYIRAENGRDLGDAPGAGPIWARYYSLKDNRPIFGDRDKSIHDTVSEISRERRDGYAWFTDAPASALKQFERWSRNQ